MLISDQPLLVEWRCWARLGWFDILSRYRRTVLGPLWITLITGVTVTAIAFVYGALFKLPITDFLPYVAIGIVVWNWISSSLLESGGAFVAYKSVILNQILNPTSIIIRIVFRNTIILGHNFLVILLLFIALDFNVSPYLLLVFPGTILVGAIIFAAAIIVAFCNARFRDLNQVLAAVVSLGFLITPVIWTVDVLAERAYIATLNPITHLLELIRAPLLGSPPSMTAWYVAGALLIVFSSAAVTLVRKYEYRLPFWL